MHDTFMLGEPDEDRIRGLLENLIPHTEHKSDYLLLMLKQLYRDMHAHEWTDKDALAFQRIEMVHDLLSSLTHHLVRKMQYSLSQILHRKLTGTITDKSIQKMISRCTSITDGLHYALATGNWNTPMYDGRQRVGVAQLLQRSTIHTAISQLRRVSSSIKQEQKLSDPRYLHPQHKGRLCFIETPEGQACGLEAQLSVAAYVSISTPIKVILSMMQPFLGKGELLVFLNGRIVGVGSESIVHLLRSARRSGQISKDVGIVLNDPTMVIPCIYVRTNSGRICRPLFILPHTSAPKDKSFPSIKKEGNGIKIPKR